MTEETQKKTRSKKRPERAKVGAGRDVLSVRGKDPNYQYRWVNDEGGRIMDLQERGYEFVRWDEIERVGDASITNVAHDTEHVAKDVGNMSGHGRLRAYLMKIPNEYFEEDQQEKQKQVDEIEQQLYPHQHPGFYGPGLQSE